MTPRQTDYQARKDRVLAIVVDEYVENIAPIGSSLIVKRYHLDLSPATVRNILAELEEEGYLTHPHTSAGRMPTQRGYRYYVDHLMHEIKLLEEEKAHIQKEYIQGVKELQDLLENASQVISDLTHYTSIVSVDGGDEVFCRGLSFVAGYPEFHNFDRIKQLLYILEGKERILELISRELEHKVEILIGSEMQFEGMDDCSLVISSYKKKNSALSGKIAVLGPTRMDYERVVSTLNYISDLMSRIL